MEKRRFTRQALHHKASFSSPYHNPQPCIIKDFCKAGLFISFDYQDGDLLQSESSPFKVGDEIFVNFEATKPISLSYRIIARVARVLDDAMGLQIIQDNPESIHALYTLAKDSASQIENTPRRSTNSPRTELLESSKAIINTFLHSVSKDIFQSNY